MRKVVVNEWMSLDGVVQSAGADDDTTGGSYTEAGTCPASTRSPSGGWSTATLGAGGFLFGRLTCGGDNGCAPGDVRRVGRTSGG